MSENGSRGARRCLFGREDHNVLNDNLSEQVIQEEKKSAEAFEKKWNFKIEDETPLPGRYEWEKVDRNAVEQSTSTSLSHLPSSEESHTAPTDIEHITVKNQSLEVFDKEKTFSDDKSVLSSSTLSDSDTEKLSTSSEEKDVNQNIVQESSKRKAPSTSFRDDTLQTEAKRAKPP